MKYQKELDFLVEIVGGAYKSIATEEMKVSDKGAFDNVTNLDFAIEKFMLKRLAEEFPSDIVVSEEFNPDNCLSKRSWTIDPIDGTVNMAHQNKLYGVQVAFLENNDVKASVIYLPQFGEWFTATKGGGAYLNGKRIYVSDRNLENAMVSLGDFSHRSEKQAEEQFELIGRLYKKIGKLRLFGAASIDFAFIASGRTDGMIMFTKNLWDIAPGWLLVAEAGAKVTNLDGESYQFGMDEIVVTATDEMLKIMKRK